MWDGGNWLIERTVWAVFSFRYHLWTQTKIPGKLEECSFKDTVKERHRYQINIKAAFFKYGWMTVKRADRRLLASHTLGRIETQSRNQSSAGDMVFSVREAGSKILSFYSQQEWWWLAYLAINDNKSTKTMDDLLCWQWIPLNPRGHLQT